MNESKFSELMKRYQGGETTPEETAFVEKWLEMRASKDPFKDLSDTEKEVIGDTILTNLSERIGTQQHKKHTFNFPMLRRVAASVLILAVTSYIVWTYSVNNEAAFLSRLSGNDVTKIILSDGSLVWLKGNSKLTYPNKFDNERHVSLVGEALFEVAKDADHPFFIHCGNLTAKVLGTSFNIKSNEKESVVEVVVLTGKVALSSTETLNNIVLLPNEKAAYNDASRTFFKESSEKKETLAVTEETEYDMHFEDTQMDEVITRIEEKFNVVINVQDKSIYSCAITVDLTDQSLEDSLEVISKVLSIQADVHANSITLIGKGCQPN